VPTLVIKSPDGSQQEQDVEQSLTIGRAEGNDLILAEGGVSRKHARFFVDGSDLLVEDVGSANGTWVDGEKIAGPTKLTTKSQVMVGDYEIQLKLGSKPLPKAAKGAARPSREPTSATGKAVKPAAPRATRVMPATRPAPGAGAALAKRPAPQRAAGPQLRGLTGGVTGKCFPLSGTLIIGRVAGVDIQVDDDSVSRRHAEVVVSGREVRLRDLGSANGTTVNGAPISEEAVLAAGDIIQFGVVEFMFETGAASGARASIARRSADGDGPPPRRGRSQEDELDARTSETTSGGPKNKRLMLVGGAAVGVLFLIVLVLAMSGGGSEGPPGPQELPGRRPRPQPVQKDPAQQLEDLLAECRTYSSSESGSPDWGRAQAACDKVLEMEPIHVEANTLLKRISILRVCQENLNRGKELVAGGDLEGALNTWAKVTRECDGYLLQTLSASKNTIAELKKRAGVECKNYAANAKWENAYKACELYSRLACQTMESKDLYPPPLMKLKLDGPLNPKTDWRPSDTLYINFLKAKDKVKPNDPPWICPDIPAFRPPPPPPDPAKAAKEEILKRYPDPEMGRALVLYFEGRFADAPVPLQKIRESMSKAALHEQTAALLLDMNNAINFYENGTAEITNDRPEKAAEHFRKALALDEKLILADRAKTLSDEERRRELERRASFVRKNIVETMSSKCLEKGRMLADRNDFRKACVMWKLGHSFSSANLDLLKALTNVCTRRASDSLDRAETCEQLKAGLDFAVDGDGFKEKFAAAMEEMNCN
jgi:pSer/pThr/pTyr-binding forkhead associated (FHA) protein